MIVQIDKFGRVLLPLKIRRKLGIEPGSKLVIEVSEDEITLTPSAAEGKLVRERGVLVWTGPIWDEDFDPIKADREQRDVKNRGQ